MRLLTLTILCCLLGACDASDRSLKSPQLSDFRGQWVVINYWAKWCKPCIEEIPELNKLDAEHDQITVLGVNYDGAQGIELAQQLEDLGVEFSTLLLDPTIELGIARPMVLPTTIILDPEGNISKTLVGPQTAASLVAATVARQ